MNQAEFRSKRSSHFFTGLGLLLIPLGSVYLVFFSTEDNFLHAHVRRGGGLMKLIEQTIGWEMFCALLLCFGAWALIYSIVSLWKVIDAAPDVVAQENRILFHPAVRKTPAAYNDISYWKIEMISGHPVLWLNFHSAYWSLQGLFPRKSLKLEGDKNQLAPLIDYFCRHPDMQQKFAR